MKKIFKTLVAACSLVVLSAFYPQPILAQQGDISLQIFYDQLRPYGQWINHYNYGYVWIPNAGADFVPYSTAGYWVNTEYGWTWVSDYEWGWAPFHYGRWNYDTQYGWIWVPDTEWGPSWVSWRRADGYYGWAPMCSGLTISLMFDRHYNNQNDHWIFVSDKDIDRKNIHRYRLNAKDYGRVISRSKIINSTYNDENSQATYVSGPSKNDVQKSTGRKQTRVNISDNNTPGQKIHDGNLQIYRLQIDKKPKPVRPQPTQISIPQEINARPTNNPPANTPKEQPIKEQPIKATPTNTRNPSSPSMNVRNERKMEGKSENKTENKTENNKRRTR
jgi:hypothetical protein